MRIDTTEHFWTEADIETARAIVKRCGIRDGLFKGPRTQNAVESIAYALSTARKEEREAAFKESAESIVNEAGKVGQLMDLASASARKEERAAVKSTLDDYFKHFPCTCVGQPRTGGHFAVCPITIRNEVLGRLQGLEAAASTKGANDG